MIDLELAGAHTVLRSPLCARCPQGPAGCCASPPGVEWSDVGRIVALGGAAWLLEQIARGALRPGERGLLIRRSDPAAIDGVTFPKRCVFHGAAGCTIAPERRAATCNYYLCDDAFAAGGEREAAPAALAARRAHEAIVALLGGWDRAIADRVRACWPAGPPWDEAFLDWLGSEHQRLSRASRRELRALNA